MTVISPVPTPRGRLEPGQILPGQGDLGPMEHGEVDDLPLTLHGVALDRTRWVAAAPFRAHVRHLMAATGLPWRVIAMTADIRPEVVDRLLRVTDPRPMRRISPVSAAALLSVTVIELQALAWQRCPVEEVRAELETLHRAGFPDPVVATFVRQSVPQVVSLRQGRRVWSSRLTWTLARAACLAHGLIDPEALAEDEAA